MLQQHLRQLTDKVIEALNAGTMEMVNLRQTLLTPDFILIGLLEQQDSRIAKLLETYYPEDKKMTRKILDRLFELQEVETKHEEQQIQQIHLAKETDTLFEIALDEAKKLGDRYVSVGALFLALFDPRVGRTADILQEFELKYNKVKEDLEIMRGGINIDEKDGEGKMDVLSQYTTDLTDMARRGDLDPVIGREKEIDIDDAAEETGAGDGLGTTLNFPLRPFSRDEDYLALVKDKLIPEMIRFKPDLIILSAGFDAHANDPLAQMEN